MFYIKTQESKYQLYAVRDKDTGETTNRKDLERLLEDITKAITSSFEHNRVINVTLMEGTKGLNISIKQDKSNNLSQCCLADCLLGK